jgi:hypothetical protein
LKALLWALRHLFKGLYGVERALDELVKCHKRSLELQEMTLLLQYGGKKPSLLTLGGAKAGDESFHWTPESEEVKREVYQKAYESMTGRKLSPYELPPTEFLEEARKLEGESVPL